MTFANEPNRAELWLSLQSILRIARPHDSKSESKWLSSFLDRQLLSHGFRPERDGFGNRWIEVPGAKPNSPRIMFSAHVDTVDASGDEKAITLDGGIVRLAKKKPGRCLGADDGAGVWLMLQMIAARIPGVYVFHRGEERGRLGSIYAQQNEAARLSGIDACIAFDRKGTTNIITHQMSQRGCSQAFANSLALAINSASNGRLAYAPDDSGAYTDSYSYFGDIAECTNISIGYQSEHGPNETLDFDHLLKLRAAILSADFSGLAIARDCTETEYLDDGFSFGGYSGGYYSPRSRGTHNSYAGGYSGGWQWDDDPKDWRLGGRDERLDDCLASLVSEHPDIAANLLSDMGVTIMDFIEAIDDNSPAAAARAYRDYIR